MLGRRLSRQQWAALLLLFIGVSIVQVQTETSPTQRSTVNATCTYRVVVLRCARYPAMHAPREQSAMVGMSAVVVACVLSGFGGVYFERMLKGGAEVTVWMRNIQLSVLSIPISFATMTVRPLLPLSPPSCVSPAGEGRPLNLCTGNVLRIRHASLVNRRHLCCGGINGGRRHQIRRQYTKGAWFTWKAQYIVVAHRASRPPSPSWWLALSPCSPSTSDRHSPSSSAPPSSAPQYIFIPNSLPLPRRQRGLRGGDPLGVLHPSPPCQMCCQTYEI